MRIPLDGFELHNLVRTPDGIRTRKGLVSVKTPTASTTYVAGFTVESPNTTEPWHYLFEQDDAAGAVTLRVYTEEFVELYSFSLGVMQRDPVITCGTAQKQLMINSPSFSAPVYGVIGGGVITAQKTDSTNEDTTALDIPAGHICSFGDRLAIAGGDTVYFNDPGLDPRSFVVENATDFGAGAIYDIFQGPDGALYVFCSGGAFSLAADALGQGQDVRGFISRIAGVEVSRPRNAVASAGRVVVLRRDGVQVLGGPKIPIGIRGGRRYLSRVTDADDLRLAGELFAVPGGVLVGFRGRRGFWAHVDLASETVSFVTGQSTSFNVVGTLRSRDGDPLMVLNNRIVVMAGRADFDSKAVMGIARGRIEVPENDRPTIRRVTIAAGNVGQETSAAIDGVPASVTKTTLARTADTVIGTSLWSASRTLAGRNTRTTRHSFAVKATAPWVELRIDGGDVPVDVTADVEITGQGRDRRDKS